MTDLEICRFVNSKDIRKYLMDIHYVFSASEAAWLVNQCYRATLQEKMDAWKDIISTMPDQSVDSFHFDEPYESIHKVLNDYLEMKSSILEMFMQESPGVFYQYMVSFNNHDYNYDYSPAYSSFEKCFHQLKAEQEDAENDEILHCSIRRSEIDGSNTITAYYSRNGEITDIEGCYNDDFHRDLSFFFDALWFHFPSPFRKGDILYDPRPHIYSGPVVMTGITPLFYKKDGLTHTDSSDMIVSGYFHEENDGTIYPEVTSNYMDFEYYPKEKLTGKKRLLKALSNYIKGDIDIDLLLRAHHIILLEEAKNDIMPHGWWTDESLRLSGIISEE